MLTGGSHTRPERACVCVRVWEMQDVKELGSLICSIMRDVHRSGFTGVAQITSKVS